MKKLYALAPWIMAVTPFVQKICAIDSNHVEPQDWHPSGNQKGASFPEGEASDLLRSTITYYPETNKFFEKFLNPNYSTEKKERIYSLENINAQLLWVYKSLQNLLNNKDSAPYAPKLKDAINATKDCIEQMVLKKYITPLNAEALSTEKNLQAEGEEKHISRIKVLSKEEASNDPIKDYPELKKALDPLNNKHKGYGNKISEICKSLVSMEEKVSIYFKFNARNYNDNIQPVKDLKNKGIPTPHQLWFYIQETQNLAKEMEYISRERDRLYAALRNIVHPLNEWSDVSTGKLCEEKTGVNFHTVSNAINNQWETIKGLNNNLYSCLENYLTKVDPK